MQSFYFYCIIDSYKIKEEMYQILIRIYAYLTIIIRKFKITNNNLIKCYKMIHH